MAILVIDGKRAKILINPCPWVLDFNLATPAVQIFCKPMLDALGVRYLEKLWMIWVRQSEISTDPGAKSPF